MDQGDNYRLQKTISTRLSELIYGQSPEDLMWENLYDDLKEEYQRISLRESKRDKILGTYVYSLDD
jgi:hypothetical protein